MSEIIGQKITDCRSMTVDELESTGWELDSNVPVIILENGVRIFPSRDAEGNDHGEFFGFGTDGEEFIVET